MPDRKKSSNKILTKEDLKRLNQHETKNNNHTKHARTSSKTDTPQSPSNNVGVSKEAKPNRPMSGSPTQHSPANKTSPGARSGAAGSKRDSRSDGIVSRGGSPRDAVCGAEKEGRYYDSPADLGSPSKKGGDLPRRGHRTSLSQESNGATPASPKTEGQAQKASQAVGSTSSSTSSKRVTTLPILNTPGEQRACTVHSNFVLPLQIPNHDAHSNIDLLDLIKKTKPSQWQQLEKSLRGLKVNTHYLKDNTGGAKPQKFKIRGLGLLHVAAGNENEQEKSKDGATKKIATPGNANSLKFTHKSTSISVADYFAKRERSLSLFKALAESDERLEHRIKLENPEAWLLDCGSKRKPTYIPAELVTVEPVQTFGEATIGSRKVKELEATNQASKTMDENEKSSGKGRPSSALQLLSQHRLGQGQQFDVVFNPKKFMVPGRILQSPQIQYLEKTSPRKSIERTHGNFKEKVSASTWNMKTEEVYTSGAKAKWKVLKLGGEDLAKEVELAFLSTSRLYNVDIDEHVLSGITVSYSSKDPEYEEALEKAFKALLEKTKANPKPGVLIVILPKDDSAAVHAKVKSLGDVKYGIHTICLSSATMKKLQDAITDRITRSRRDDCIRDNLGKRRAEAALARYHASIVLKYNLKTGGINHVLQNGSLSLPEVQNGILFIGIDMAHHTFKSKTTTTGPKTVVGIVANTDADCAQWPGDIRVQPGNSEMVEDLESIVRARLRHFIDTKRTKPSQIIIYRAGVSNGQYAQILKTELPMIKEACKDEGKISVAVIVVSQGHQGRFFRVNDGEVKGHGQGRGKGETGVYPAGTVVGRGSEKSGAIAPRSWDFFLQAHATGVSGKAKPIHYTLITDDAAHSPHDIERLTNNLCYMVGESTRAMAVCAPAYYAGKICERGGLLLKGMVGEDGKEEKGEMGEGVVNERLKNSMFYI